MTKNTLNGVAPLTDIGLIRVQGEDAAKFLHGQLTQDFVLLDQTQARLAAFCSAKGRMQASFIGFKYNASDILLLCHSDILAATLKRLRMFVMRAKVTLSDATAELVVYGLAGTACLNALSSGAPTNHQIWDKTTSDGVILVSLYPADGVQRALWIAPTETTAPAGEPLSSGLWAWGEVRSGIAMISGPVMEAFVPQMLNYESVGGVNFKKGCYPGQEVVARSQFRGTLKRRAYLAHCAQAMQAGDEVFSEDSPDQACGTVVQAATAPEGGFDAIVSMQISAFEANQVHLRSANGPKLDLAMPPYNLLADV